MPPDLDLSQLSDADKDALIKALFERLGAAERRISELEAKLGEPPKPPDNSSLPPSKGQKANRRDTPKGGGPRQDSLGGEGGGRLLACDPDQTVIARPRASSTARSMPLWCSRRPIETAGDCANDTVPSVAACSLSSNIPMCHLTIMAANENCDPPQPTARLPADSGQSWAPNGSPISAQWSVRPRTDACATR
jgi:hypothetical protein